MRRDLPRTAGAPGEVALAVRELAVPFGRAPGLRAVTLAVAAGERVAVVGPSGVGKTTLLRAVAGLAPVSAGTVEVGGRDVTRLPSERRDAVYLHQTPVLLAHLRVRDDVAFPLDVRGVRGSARDETVRRALAAVRLDGLGDRWPHELSGGQRHRVALARAIAARPAALLLDEPLAALDPALRVEVREAIVAAQAEHPAALLLVSHDLDDAAALAHRVAVLLDGAVAQLAAPAELFARPASLAVARFLALHRELAGEVDGHGVFRSPFGAAALPPGVAPPPGPVIAVVPAAAVRLVSRDDAAAACGAEATVAGVVPRARGGTLVVRAADAALEAPLPRDGAPPAGALVHVALDARLLTVFPA